MPKTMTSPHSLYTYSTRSQTRLDQQSHLLVVILGTLIGAVFALFIGYHLNSSWENLWLVSLPLGMSYLLRKVYIYTLLHYQE